MLVLSCSDSHLVPSILSEEMKHYTTVSTRTLSHMSRLVTKPTMWLCAQRRLRSAWVFAQSDQSPGGGGISDTNLVQVCRWASSYPPYKCILEYGKSIPINVYTIMEDNNKCSIFPFSWGIFMKISINLVK